MKTHSHLIITAASVHVASAAGYLRGDDGGIGDTSLSISSRRLDVVGGKADYGVINFDLIEVSILGVLCYDGPTQHHHMSHIFSSSIHYVLISQADGNGKKLQQEVRALESCPDGTYSLITAITTDNKPSDNGWALLNDGGNTLAQGEMSEWASGSLTKLHMCLPFGTFKFRVTDRGDGMCRNDGCGSVIVTLDDVEIGKMENDNSQWSRKEFPINAGVLAGKSASVATTTTSTTTTSTTTTTTTTTTSNWCEQVKQLFPQDEGVSPCEDGQHRVEVDLRIDCFGEETSWKVKNHNGDVVMSLGSEIPAFGQSNVMQCLPAGKYEFTIKDFDGLKNPGHCNHEGYYKVKVNNKELIAGSRFIESKTHHFSAGAIDWISNMTERDCEWAVSHHVRRQRNHEENGKEYHPLKWSDDIYQGAKNWANHLLDDCKEDTIDHESGIGYSENLAKNHGTKGTDWGSRRSADAIAWRFSEREQMPDMDQWPNNAHHTALNWYASRYFACADAEREITKDHVCHVQVCRYATQGNCGMGEFRNPVTNVIDTTQAFMSDSSRCGKYCPEDSAGDEVCYN